MTAMRRLIDPPTDGPTNMARDEAILQRVGDGQSPPTLRFYRWSPATISLGYFQPYAQFASLPPPAGDLAVVRRQTGGGAILHDIELTYSLALPLDHPLLRQAGPSRLYEHVHTVFAQLLTGLGIPVTRGPTGAGTRSHTGPFFCFQRHSRFDLLADGRKLMGSAQRRTTTAVLQHGSLILDSRFDQQSCATVAAYADFDIDARLPQLAGEIAHAPVSDPGTLDPAELELAARLRDKYAGQAWTARR